MPAHVSRNPEGRGSPNTPEQWRYLCRESADVQLGGSLRRQVLRFQTTTPPSDPSVARDSDPSVARGPSRSHESDPSSPGGPTQS